MIGQPQPTSAAQCLAWHREVLPGDNLDFQLLDIKTNSDNPRKSRSNLFFNMRLLNVDTYQLHEFMEGEIPEYAILSHRWEHNEIIFKDICSIEDPRDLEKLKIEKPESWSKLEGCCKRATLGNCQWVWIDTCCIDKSSSAELSEAINSMFKWYQDAEFCYAYLSDVAARTEESINDKKSKLRSEFCSSKWFTRGWTLQELLAPGFLEFFNVDWEQLGVRAELWHLVAEVTGIESESRWEFASIAQKMSWAARRVTTRTEDRAYSLMGMFGVNMPPLYGEGDKAFYRLQLEILKDSDDESIFAWQSGKFTLGGLLASSPADFQDSGDIIRFEQSGHWRPPYTMTNKGLRIELPLYQAPLKFDSDDTCLAALQCRNSGHNSLLHVLLRHVHGHQWRRVSLALRPHSISQKAGDGPRTVQVMQYKSRSSNGPCTFSMDSDILSLHGFDWTDRICSAFGGDITDSMNLNMDDNGKISFTPPGFLAQATVALEFSRTGRIWPHKKERVFLIFNIHHGRIRFGMYVPEVSKTTIKSLLKSFQSVYDWMTEKETLFQREIEFSAETKIVARLIRDWEILDGQTYKLELSITGDVMMDEED